MAAPSSLVQNGVKPYHTKPFIPMGVTMNVNSPADNTTENQTLNQNQQTSSQKLYPIDFTSPSRDNRVYEMIQSTQEIMNVIEGPKLISLNPAVANDVNVAVTRDRLHSAYGPFTVEPQYWGHVNSANVMTISYYNEKSRLVRRPYDNAEAQAAIDFMNTNYNQQASRVVSNAPLNGLYHYPFIFSNYDMSSTLRNLNVSPIVHWLNDIYTAPSSPPQVSVLKVSTLNTNINSSTVFPGATVPFPANSIAIDCSTLSTNTIGKLYKLSPYIIDVSNTHEGLFNAVTSGRYDSDIGLALDNTFPKQDIDLAMFLGHVYVPQYLFPATTASLTLRDFKYDPVEGIFSYFSIKKYESNDKTLSSYSTVTTYRQNVISSYRNAITYLLQQAAKQMRIWCTPKFVLDNKTYDANTINFNLSFNLYNQDYCYLNSNYPNRYYNWPAWIAYEYVKSSNNNIELDNPGWISGIGHHMIANKARKPRSYGTGANSSLTVYDKFGVANVIFDTFNKTYYCYPTSIYCKTLDDRVIQSSVAWDDNSLLTDWYLEQSDYFPEPDLVTDL